MSLTYEINVRDFTCPNCGEFSDEISRTSADIMDDTITALCCDSEFWLSDLEDEGFNVREITHA